MRVPVQILAVALVALSACDGKSSSPTQPTPLAPPPPNALILTEETHWGIRLNNEEGEYPTEYETLLDGEVVLSPWWWEGFEDPFNLAGFREGRLLPGRHTLGFRVLQSGHGRATYRLSGRVISGRWPEWNSVPSGPRLTGDGPPLETQDAAWEETVRLGPGDTWTGSFEIRPWSGGG